MRARGRGKDSFRGGKDISAGRGDRSGSNDAVKELPVLKETIFEGWVILFVSVGGEIIADGEPGRAGDFRGSKNEPRRGFMNSIKKLTEVRL